MAVSVAVRIDGRLHDCATDLSPDSIFPIYSITKTLTAICAVRAAEARMLALDIPVRECLPEVDIPESVTLTHLLHHTSGLGDYGPLASYHQAVRRHPDRPWTRQQFLDAVLPNGLYFAPGQGWSYSNVGYMLVADILERLAGRSVAALLAEFVCRPLGLQRTSMLETTDDLMACVPGLGTEVSEDGTAVDVRGRYHPGWCAPRVAASTAAETTRIFDGLFTGELISESNLRRMVTLRPLPGVWSPPLVISAGMGVYSNTASSYGPNYGHGGEGPGYNSTADVYLETAVGRVAAAVFEDSSLEPRARDIAHAMVGQLLDDSCRAS